jgi:hypothetical protein
MEEPVLLRERRVERERQVNFARRNALERHAERAHYGLPIEACPHSAFEVGVPRGKRRRRRHWWSGIVGDIRWSLRAAGDNELAVVN